MKAVEIIMVQDGLTKMMPVWLLHDGKIGLRNQAMGVAEAVGLPFADKTLVIRPPWRFLPPALWLGALHAPGPKGDRLNPPWPILVISAGGRAAAPALAIRHAAGGKCLAVQIQNPHVRNGAFDLLVAPDHDRVAGANVVVTHGAVHRVTAAKLEEAAAIWRPRLSHLPHPRVAVLIGGGNGSYHLPLDRMREIAQSLAALAQQGYGLMITPSRRTGSEATQVLKDTLAGLPAEIWDNEGENPYFGYLGLADHVVATADSISMITESRATGRPVHILPLPGGAAKFERFHALMREAGVTRIFDGQLETWTYPPRDDTKIVGERIRQMLEQRGLLDYWGGVT